MKKLLSIAAVGAVVLAACGGGSGIVASTVNGQEITVGDVEALIDNDGAAVTKEEFAQLLAFRIQWTIIDDAAESDFGLTPTDDEVTTEADRLIDEGLSEGQTREDFLAGQGITEQYLRNAARQNLLVLAIREVMLEDLVDPTPEEIDAELTAVISALTSVCASHILVATEDEALDVVKRLEDGEDFAELAAELSTDTGSGANGGALGCATPETYVEPFAEATKVAPLGEIYEEIVESQFGFHVLMVTEREEPAEEDLPTDDELVEAIKEDSVLGELEDWFLGAVAEADVTVEEEYGTWQANPPTVVPPAT